MANRVQRLAGPGFTKIPNANRQATLTDARLRADEGKPQWTQLYNDCMVRVIQARRSALSQWMHTGDAPPPEASLPK